MKFPLNPIIASLFLYGFSHAADTTLKFKISDLGRTFEGLGAVSAGASSRLLIDYPEPQRSEILDYLFKPNFGASLQHLKVEIGGDVNSTDGTEPSHMRSRDDENYERGYEWWLMKEAKKRNPDIIFDCLAWGAPGWIGGGNFYSQDMADYVVKFILGAKKVHDIDITYTGVWNEMPWNKEWVKLLRRTLDAKGLQHVTIVAADQYDGSKWEVAKMAMDDPEFDQALGVVGVHYPEGSSPEYAQKSGKRLWSSEDGSKPGDWRSAMRIARLYNRNYVGGRMTKTLVWSPIASFYDNLPYARTGHMIANEPWSGHYVVEPAIWITAHTTQFAKPGWKYIDTACRMIDGGSVVVMKSPDGKDLSVMVETIDAKQPQTLIIRPEGITLRPLDVWLTSERQQFIKLQPLAPEDGAYTINVEPGSLYTLTTTRGQAKGAAAPPASMPFPFPYKEDFEGTATNKTPRYFSDSSGTYEVVERHDGKGKSLRQVMPALGIRWMHPNPLPQTLIGSRCWRDYQVSTDVLVEKSGAAKLFGRVGDLDQGGQPATGYCLSVSTSGTWDLSSTFWQAPKQSTTQSLASGKIDFKADSWHQLQLVFHGEKITALINGKTVADVSDSTQPEGSIALGGDWNHAQFDNLEITGKPIHPLVGTMTGSSQWDDSFRPSDAGDGRVETRWNAAAGRSGGEWLEIDLASTQAINQAVFRQFEERVTRYRIQYWDGTQWADAFRGGAMKSYQCVSFPEVRSAKIRLLIEQTNGKEPSLFEFQIRHAR
jgi:hypothetical protein